MAYALADLDDIQEHRPMREELRYEAHCELPEEKPLSRLPLIPPVFSVQSRIGEMEKRRKKK